MTPRDCCKRLLSFESTDYIPNYDSGLMSQRIQDEWHEQGMPADQDYLTYFGINRRHVFKSAAFDPIPGVRGQGIIFEDDMRRVIRDSWGQETEWPKKAGMAEGSRLVLRYAIQNRKDWERIREHFNPNESLRFPKAWDQSNPPLWIRGIVKPAAPYARIHPREWTDLKNDWADQDLLLQINAPSMIGELKEVMGFEQFCMFIYDDRDLIEEIIETRTNVALVVLERMFDEVQFDVMHFWEDIAFNGGPILSPEIFSELAVPRYRKLVDLFREKGGKIVSVDSDGDIRKLIPGWLEGGINNFWPLEVKAGMDVVALRNEYGHAFTLRGGINKYVLPDGRESIIHELERVASVAEGGGYLPTLDHHVPCGVTFENYAYYMDQKKKILGVA